MGDVIDYPQTILTYPPTGLNFQHSRLLATEPDPIILSSNSYSITLGIILLNYKKLTI